MLAQSRPNLQPEAQLLLCSARTQMDPASAERISALLQENIDWNYLLQLAFHHHVAPLLYRSLETVAPAAIPEMARVELKRQIQANIQGNLFLTKELFHLLALLKQSNIPALPYKGPVLAASVYGDLALRPFNDLDILVHEQDLVPAMDLLIAGGYEIIRPSNVAQMEKGLQSHRVNRLVEESPWAYQLVLWHPQKQIVVELHWRITPRYVFPYNPEQLWDDSKLVILGEVIVLGFAPEDLLWFLCVHGSKHQWERLGWLCDIAELIRQYPHLNWEQIVVQAMELGIERRLYLGLFLAKCMLGTSLPKAVETKIHAFPQIRNLARRVMKRAFDDAEKANSLSRVDELAFQLKTMDRMTDRIRFVFYFVTRNDAPPITDRGSAKPPSISSWLSYFVRIFRLVKAYGPSLLRRLFRLG